MKLLRFFQHRPQSVPAASDWNRAYAAQTYDGVNDRFQWARYAIFGGILQRSGSLFVLDIGCGYGGLRDYLPPVRSYTGMDIAMVALEGLARKPSEKFVCADVEQWQPEEVYDAIVFSEMLYYLNDVEATLAKLLGALSAEGVMAASFFQHANRKSPNQRALEITRKFLREQFAEFEEIEISADGHVRSLLYGRKRVSA